MHRVTKLLISAYIKFNKPIAVDADRGGAEGKSESVKKSDKWKVTARPARGL